MMARSSLFVENARDGELVLLSLSLDARALPLCCELV